LKRRIKKASKSKTNYRNIMIMAVLFGALLIGGSITAFSNFGKNNNRGGNESEKVEQLVSILSTPSLPGANALGSNNATITVVEFGDYQCPYCARFNVETKDQLITNYVDTGVVKFVFKDFILNDLPQDKLSTLAAEASYCAAEQNKYWQFHDEVYKNSHGENTGWVSKESLIGFAKTANIPNIEQFTSCLDSHKYNQIVVKNDAVAKDLGLQATPTFLILKQNSTKVAGFEGAQPIQAFDNVIGQMLNGTM
jgi:protein-disulfide isomerase